MSLSRAASRASSTLLRTPCCRETLASHARFSHDPSSSRSSASKDTHFGFQTVPESMKEGLVREVFDSVASSYDLMNDAMSMGVHRLWKDTFVSTLINPGRNGPIRCIDVAGGTGDIALRILDHAKDKFADRETVVDVVDINTEMLKEGQKRLKKSMYWNTPQIAFHEGNAQQLSPETFLTNSYDLYTIAFGIRNVTDIPAALREAHRVLKPGGVFSCLEFSKVKNPLFAQAYEQYSFSVIPLLGTILAGDRASYQYLVESIQRFPSQSDFARMIREAGFKTGGDFEGKGGAWHDLWGGIAAVHMGVKL